MSFLKNIFQFKSKNATEPSIALVTATPPSFNPGMLLSQIVARSFIQRHNLGDKTTFYRLVSMDRRLNYLQPAEKAAYLARIDDGITYHPLESTEQLRDTVPLFWGDLLHMHQYLNSIRRLVPNGESTPENLLLLKDAPDDVLARVVSFGTTFLFHSATDMADENFGPVFQRFVRGAKCILPRDMVSTAQLAMLAPQSSFSLGLDVTQLICLMENWSDLFPEGIDTSIADDNTGLCFFARGNHTLEKLTDVINLLSSEFNIPIHWLPWGDRLSFPHVKDYEEKLGLETLAGNLAPRLSALLDAVARATFIVTDTYHLAVIAWSLGTPALTICGNHWEGDFNAVVDKRYIFHVQHGLQEFFIDKAAENHSQLKEHIHNFFIEVRNRKTAAWYKASVAARAKSCEQKLIQVLKG